MEVELEKDASELHREVEEDDEVHSEAERVSKEHPSSLIITMATIPESSLLD